MNKVQWTGSLIIGAALGGVIALLGAAVVMVILGLLGGYGLGALMISLYFGGGLLIYVLPMGLLIGAIVTAFRLVRCQPLTSLPAYALWLSVPLVLLVGLVFLPYRLTNNETIVTHGARWTIMADSNCAVKLQLVEYTYEEFVCSHEVARYLEAQNAAVIPIQYRVTSDFGEPRSYQLIKVASIDITWEQWESGGSGCGGDHLHSCDSPQAQRGSPLLKSSWTDE